MGNLIEKVEQKRRWKKHGLKYLFIKIKTISQIIWKGSPKEKIKDLYSYYESENESLSSNQNNDDLLKSEKDYLLKYKVEYEIGRLKQMQGGYEFEIQESGIRVIEIGVINWFREAWMEHETDTKNIRFYLWLEADYFEHFQQFVKHKNSYFESSDIQNRNEACLSFFKWMAIVVGYIITFLAGVNWYDVSQFVATSTFLQRHKALKLGSALLLIVIFIIALFYIVKAFLNTEYLKRDSILRQKKETWLRHVESISNYQKEMLGFLWNLEEYQTCPSIEEKKKLLMNNIVKVWMKDNNKFQSNMAPESKKRN